MEDTSLLRQMVILMIQVRRLQSLKIREMTTIVGEDVEEERREGREGGRSLLLKNLISDDQTDVLLD